MERPQQNQWVRVLVRWFLTHNIRGWGVDCLLGGFLGRLESMAGWIPPLPWAGGGCGVWGEQGTLMLRLSAILIPPFVVVKGGEDSAFGWGLGQGAARGGRAGWFGGAGIGKGLWHGLP